MNILFIIGNGFDLNLGMKTGYSNFNEHYLARKSKSSSVNKLKETISKDLKNWSDLELELGRYTDNFESQKEFEEVFEDIVENLAEYLQYEEEKIKTKEIDNSKILEYLSFPERSLLKADITKLNSFKNNWSSYHWNVNVVTFNYTQTLERLIGTEYSNIEISKHDGSSIMLRGIEHIHGYLNNRMVMGVNDVSQITNKSFHNNQDVLEALVKSICNQVQKHTIDDLCKQQISSANLICIFGSSIGDTDNMWWDLIGQQLKRDCKLIIFNRCEYIPNRKEYKIGAKERELKKMFLSKTILTEKEKENVTENIYIGINTDMFKLIEETPHSVEVRASIESI